MKNIGVVLWYIVFLFCVSCRREHSASEVDSICNNSSKSVKVSYYKNGKSDQNLFITSINKNDCDVVFNENGMGGTSNYINKIIDVDSILMVYEDNTQIVHYGYFIQSGSNPKALSFENSRNLLNGQNWTSNSSKSKHTISTKLYFIITEQDYLDAKNK